MMTKMTLLRTITRMTYIVTILGKKNDDEDDIFNAMITMTECGKISGFAATS